MFSERKSYEPIKLYANLEIITDVEALNRTGLVGRGVDSITRLSKPKSETKREYHQENVLPRLNKSYKKRPVPVTVTNVGTPCRSVDVPRPDVLAGVTPRVPKNWYSRYTTEPKTELHVTNIELPAVPVKADRRSVDRRAGRYKQLCEDERVLYEDLHGELADYRRKVEARSVRARFETDLIGDNVDEIVAIEDLVETCRSESIRTNTPKGSAFVDVEAERTPDRCEKVHEWFNRTTPDDEPLYPNNASFVKKKHRQRTVVARDMTAETTAVLERHKTRNSKTDKYVKLLKTISNRIDKLKDTLACKPKQSCVECVECAETPVVKLPDIVPKTRTSFVRFESVERAVAVLADTKKVTLDEACSATRFTVETTNVDDTGYETGVKESDCVDSETQTRQNESKQRSVQTRRDEAEQKYVQTEQDVRSKLTPRSLELFRNDFKMDDDVVETPRKVGCDCAVCLPKKHDEPKAGESPTVSGQKDVRASVEPKAVDYNKISPKGHEPNPVQKTLQDSPKINKCDCPTGCGPNPVRKTLQEPPNPVQKTLQDPPKVNKCDCPTGCGPNPVRKTLDVVVADRKKPTCDYSDAVQTKEQKKAPKPICDCKECYTAPKKTTTSGDIDTSYLQNRAQVIYERLSGTLQDLYDTITRSEYLKKELGSIDLSTGQIDYERYEGEVKTFLDRSKSNDDVKFDVTDSAVEELERTIDYQQFGVSRDVSFLEEPSVDDAKSNVGVKTSKKSSESAYFERIDSMRRSGEIRIDTIVQTKHAETTQKKFGVKKCTKCRCVPKDRRIDIVVKCACAPKQ